MATLKLGMDILVVEEGVRLDTLLGHGGLFKTPVAGQKLLAGALGVTFTRDCPRSRLRITIRII